MRQPVRWPVAKQRYGLFMAPNTWRTSRVAEKRVNEGARFVGPGAEVLGLVGVVPTGPDAWHLVSEQLTSRHSSAVLLCLQALAGKRPLHLEVCPCGRVFPLAADLSKSGALCTRCKQQAATTNH